MMRRDRPDELVGISQRISTGYGEVYVRINVNMEPGGRDKIVTERDILNAQPFEVFIDVGNSGGFTKGFCEGLAKSLSNGLRDARTPRTLAAEAADDLVGIRSDKIGNDNGDQIYSIPDAVGIAIIRFLTENIGEPIRNNDTGEIMEINY